MQGLLRKYQQVHQIPAWLADYFYLDKKDSEKPKTDMFLTGFGHEKNDATDGLEDLLSEASEKKKKEVENPFRKASDE